MKNVFFAAVTAFASLIMLLTPIGRAGQLPKTEPVYEPTPQYQNSVYYNNLSELRLSGSGRLDAANVALSQCGYHEGDSVDELNGMSLNGTKDFTEYGYWYGTYVVGTVPFYTPWCAMFISWCAREAALPVSVINNASYARVGSNPAHFNVAYREAAGYLPKCGDLIFYDFTGTNQNWNHVGLVLYVENDMVYSIEGNINKCTSIRRHYLSDATIRGYGIPKYRDSDPNAFCMLKYPVPQRTIKLGDGGEDVKWLQCALVHLGYPAPADGYFGTNTQRLLKRLQANNGLQQDGICGSVTRSAVQRLLNDRGCVHVSPSNYSEPERTLQYGDSGSGVKWLQASLGMLGFSSSVTGYYGDYTAARVAMIQRTCGLIPTGVCDSVTRSCIAHMTGDSAGAPLSIPGGVLQVTATPGPTVMPTAAPTTVPTAAPTNAPTAAPTNAPTAAPTPGTTPVPGDPFDPANYPVPERTLSKGMSGDDVRWLQAVLRLMGADLNVTGYFGSKTQASVLEVQKANNLPTTGKCASKTRRVLLDFLSGLETQSPAPTAEPTAAPTPSTNDPFDPADYPVPDRTLSKGMSGDDVRWLQAALRLMGAEFNVTGYFGSQTQAFVIRVQRQYGLPQTGICASKTRTAIIGFLDSLGAPSAPPDPYEPSSYPVPTRNLSKGMSGDDVRWLQAALRRMGATFNVTGYFGSQTQAFVKRIQSENGLPQTGICASRTRAVILEFLDSVNATVLPADT